MKAALMRSEFRIPGMDCPSEAQMVRMRLADMAVTALACDLPARRLVVCHEGDAGAILARLVPLGHGAELQASAPVAAPEGVTLRGDGRAQDRVAWQLAGCRRVLWHEKTNPALHAASASSLSFAGLYGLNLEQRTRSQRH